MENDLKRRLMLRPLGLKPEPMTEAELAATRLFCAQAIAALDHMERARKERPEWIAR